MRQLGRPAPAALLEGSSRVRVCSRGAVGDADPHCDLDAVRAASETAAARGGEVAVHVVRGGDAKLASKLATPASEEALDEAIAAAVRGADVGRGGGGS